MIDTREIYNTVLSLVRKDKRGLSFSPDDFNNAVVQVNQRVYKENYKNFEASKLSIDEMDSLKIVGYTVPLVAGLGSLPANYFHLVGNPYYTHPTAGRRQIDLITSLEHGQREMDYLTKASALYPTAFMGYGATSADMSIYVTPTTITSIYIDYLREVATPHLDYYINDTTLEITLTAEGEGVTIPVGCTGAHGEVAGTNLTSGTINFDWHEHDVPFIINYFLELVGISLPDQLLIETSNLDEAKIERK